VSSLSLLPPLLAEGSTAFFCFDFLFAAAETAAAARGAGVDLQFGIVEETRITEDPSEDDDEDKDRSSSARSR
jgi:hypothetical protein